jgi:hypothetical protein
VTVAKHMQGASQRKTCDSQHMLHSNEFGLGAVHVFSQRGTTVFHRMRRQQRHAWRKRSASQTTMMCDNVDTEQFCWQGRPHVKAAGLGPLAGCMPPFSSFLSTCNIACTPAEDVCTDGRAAYITLVPEDPSLNMAESTAVPPDGTLALSSLPTRTDTARGPRDPMCPSDHTAWQLHC